MSESVVSEKLLEALRTSSYDDQVELLPGVFGFREGQDQSDFESYIVAAYGNTDALPVQVTVSGNGQWITFGPVDPQTGELPDDLYGKPHASQAAACAWAAESQIPHL